MSTKGLSILESGFGLGGYIARGISHLAELPHPSLMGTDEAWMRLALLEAMEAIGRTSPNPAVGAIIVKEGKLLAKASTQVYGSFHAEAMALKLLPKGGAAGATCYVTLEPCGGIGKQGPCAEALIQAGIKRVVIAASDPHEKAGGLGVKKLRAANIEISEGVLAAEAKAWHFPFLAYQIKRSPIVIGKWAQTLDGHLADDNDNSQWISGPRSRAYTHWLRQKYDAIMVGVHTVLRDKPRLTARDSAEPIARHPHKIIFDPSGRMQIADQAVIDALLEDATAHGTLVYWCTEPKIKDYSANLLPYREQIIHFPKIHLDRWQEFFRDLSVDHQQRLGRELQSVMVEGGSQLLTLLMRADQLDAAHIFVRAGFLGGSRNRIAHLHQGENPSLSLMQRHDYRLIAAQQIDDDVLMECVQNRFDLWNAAKA